jgi:hypothetical protein
MRIGDDDPSSGDARTRALIALARFELDADASTWPMRELGGEGFAAAALRTDGLDLLPRTLTDTAELWCVLPAPFQMFIWQRNPAPAVYRAQAARCR